MKLLSMNNTFSLTIILSLALTFPQSLLLAATALTGVMDSDIRTLKTENAELTITGIAQRICKHTKYLNVAPYNDRTIPGANGATSTDVGYERCVEEAEKIAKELYDTDSAPEDCAETKKEFREYAGACKKISNIDSLLKSSEKKYSTLRKCQIGFDRCLDIYTSKKSTSDKKKEACSFMKMKGRSQESIDDIADNISDAKTDLAKNMAESQKKAQEAISNRQEQVKELQEALQQGMVKIQQAEQAVVDINYELENENTQVELNLENELLQLRSQLDLAEGKGVFDVEAEYDRRLQEEKQACLSEGTNEYNEYKKMLQTTNASGKGVTNAQISKYTSKTPTEWANYFSTRCLNSTTYLAKVKQYNQERVSALAAKTNEIKTIQSQIQLKISAARKQVLSLAKSGQLKRQKAYALRNQLTQANNQLQQQINQLQRPDQSTILTQMQQQQTFMQEMQAVQDMESKHKGLENIIVEEDDFKSFKSVMGLDTEGESTDLELDYEVCRGVSSKKRKRGAGASQ